MQILGAPTTLELRTAEPLRLSLLVHNESDDDVVCFPAFEGVAQAADVEFDPALGFIEARSTARFDVRVRRLDSSEIEQGGVMARWLLFAEGVLQDHRPCIVSVEPPRNVRAEFAGTRALSLENLGTRTESLSIRVAPGFGGDLLVPSGPFEIAPGEQREVPIYIGGGEATTDHLGLLIVGGPEPILLHLDVRPEFALASAGTPRAYRSAVWRPHRAAVAAWGAALAAGLALAMVAGGRLPVIAPLSTAPVLAPARTAVEHHAIRLSNVSSPASSLAVPSSVYVAVAQAKRHYGGAPKVRAARYHVRPGQPPPAIVAFNVPDTAGSGGNVRVRFATKRAAQVEVVAKVGPVVVADHVTSATSGSVTLTVPRANQWVKIMTVRVMAQRDGGHATRSALVAILPPGNPPASEQVSLRY
ncbi:hypothetical protein EPN44_04345 [bacterium]|nr:MAG: hypothetical protein EPN44_04345 [bacterium]